MSHPAGQTGRQVGWKFNDQTAQAMRQIEALTDKDMDALAEETKEVAKDEAPVLTGNLKASVDAIRIASRIYRVITQTGYGAFVNLGTVHMAANPHLARGFAVANRHAFRK